MAPAPEDAGEHIQPSSSDQQAQARVRRRARKRNGPPQLQFLTATDLSQFKDENAKRSVRSQAMIQYRYKAEQQKRKGKEPCEERAPENEPVAGPAGSIKSRERPHSGREKAPMAPVLNEQQEPEHLYPSTSAAWHGTNPDDGYTVSSWPPDTSAHVPIRSSRYYHALSIVPLNTAAEKVLQYNEDDDQEATNMRMLGDQIATVNHIGDGVDPFIVMPQFASPELSSVDLVRKCTRGFVTQSTMDKWVPTMLAHSHILLSSTLLASTWLDMHAGCSGDSKRTTLVKSETLGWINSRLRDPTAQFEDFTLMVILHLLAGEMWSCNENTLRIHQSGVARLIATRGGMHVLGGNGALAEVSASCCLHCNIFCEAVPLPIFDNWEPSQFAPVPETAALPESPLFCPRREYFNLLGSPQCSALTYELLCDMQDLTDLFLAYNKRTDAVLDADEAAGNVNQELSMATYNATLAGFQTKLATLPSAYTPGLPTTNDWIYESCRIAAIIYASAIILRVPFSVAAEPGRSPILAESASRTRPLVGDHLLSTRLAEALYEVLEKSNMNDIWGPMSGVLYWVTLVGAAAARTPGSINMSPKPRFRSEAYTTWVRRCLIMFATRCMILLIFQHPVPVIVAQKRLLQVQRLLGSGASTWPVS